MSSYNLFGALYSLLGLCIGCRISPLPFPPRAPWRRQRWLKAVLATPTMESKKATQHARGNFMEVVSLFTLLKQIHPQTFSNSCVVQPHMESNKATRLVGFTWAQSLQVASEIPNHKADDQPFKAKNDALHTRLARDFLFALDGRSSTL